MAMLPRYVMLNGYGPIVYALWSQPPFWRRYSYVVLPQPRWGKYRPATDQQLPPEWFAQQWLDPLMVPKTRPSLKAMGVPPVRVDEELSAAIRRTTDEIMAKRRSTMTVDDRQRLANIRRDLGDSSDETEIELIPRNVEPTVDEEIAKGNGWHLAGYRDARHWVRQKPKPQEKAMPVHDAEPGDIYVDDSGKLWRCVRPPSVSFEEVEGQVKMDASGAWVTHKQHCEGALGGPLWNGWKRIWRKEQA
jgi:hypothetical protein